MMLIYAQMLICWVYFGMYVEWGRDVSQQLDLYWMKLGSIVVGGLISC